MLSWNGHREMQKNRKVQDKSISIFSYFKQTFLILFSKIQVLHPNLGAMSKILLYSQFLFVCLLWGCQQNGKQFYLLPPSQSGVDFSNTITTSDSFNALYYEYIYNGSGVAATDINSDGMADLFFAGNQVSSRLYLNRGNLKFVDVTEAAGVSTDRWCTGVAVADVNNDGKQDIYVSVAGYQVPEYKMENLLFINQGNNEDGIPIFLEKAAEYGLNDSGYSTQGAFFDYDLDGDLDLYLLTNALEKFHRNTLRPKKITGESASTDRLFQNNGNGTFTNVSQQAGILIEGYGLGVNISDFNFDGFPDVYASNDFLSNDLLWINKGDGTFVNKAPDVLKHQSHNGMGMDVSDFNNDGLPDILVLDMLPPDNYRQKMMIPAMNYDLFWMKKQMGYQDQYMRNTLQLNSGLSPNGLPNFSEIGNLANITATDWSWAVLFADFDQDGWKDAFITNGYRKDVTNLDYISYSNYNSIFGTVEAKQEKAVDELHQLQEIEVSNYFFRNQKDLSFREVTSEWVNNHPSFSNGAAFADLDNDGDLDLVVNNMDAPAFLYINQANGANNYIALQLTENQPHITPYNAKVWVYTGQYHQFQELSLFRGYKSTVQDVLNFGLGNVHKIDSILVYWPDGKFSKIENVASNQKLVIRYETAMFRQNKSTLANTKQLFEPTYNGLQFSHLPNTVFDQKTVRTLPHEYSWQGPPITCGDVNGDGLTDVFIGGNYDQSGVLFLQQSNGQFSGVALELDRECQDTDATFLDSDNDGDLDLFVVSGGSKYPQGSPHYQDRLYENNGKGTFTRKSDALPQAYYAGSCVTATDFDGDGDMDLFIGGKAQPGKYPFAEPSYLLINNQGVFSQSTPQGFQNLGLVSDAIWTDFNLDNLPDLMVVGEWMPISFFQNNNGKLSPVHPKLHSDLIPDFKHSNGWWFHINSGDLDNDGDPDYLIGNLGLNNRLKATVNEPVQLYTKDFDNNQTLDPLLTCFIQGEKYLFHDRDILIAQIPGIKRRFPNYSSYAASTFENILTEKDLEDTYLLSSYLFSSIFLENLGASNFKMHELPKNSQNAPIFCSILTDLNQDSLPDIVAAGNFHGTEVNQIGWYDASFGNILLNNGEMQFKYINPIEKGLKADGDARAMATIMTHGNKPVLVIGNFGQPLMVYNFR